MDEYTRGEKNGITEATLDSVSGQLRTMRDENRDDHKDIYGKINKIQWWLIGTLVAILAIFVKEWK